MAQGGDAPFQGGKEPPPPTWDGNEPGLELAVFEKNVKLWEYESELDPKKRGVRLLRSLTGVARSITDTLEFEEVACEKGVTNIMNTLRAHFAPHMEVSLPRAFERAIYGQPRSHKESMQEYLIRTEKNFHLLEKESLKLPDQALGYVAYRQASLTEAQDLKFCTWSQGKFDYKTVATCLRKLEKVIPEHKTKSATAFIQEQNGEFPEETFDESDGGVPDEGDQWVYIEEGDADKIWDEAEVQVALATYQEVRKAINAHQKNRQYYGGGKGDGRGSSTYKSFVRGKKKIRIEELKLRTKCGRCGLTGHWAKECNNPPDQRGRAAMSKASTSSVSSGPSQQSWYVSAGSGCASMIVSSELLFQCYGVNKNTEGVYNRVLGMLDHEDTVVCDCDLKGLGVFNSHVAVPKPLNVALFVGLTASPNLAIVDTAAQDGLIGSFALERLKEQLAGFGLKVAWTGRQAKAQGVGGQAKVLGVVAIPLGIAESSGILEATVVEGEVPLLLPIKMLKSLRAVIDVDGSCLFFRQLRRSVQLHTLPSGHVAIEIFEFGRDGFSFPLHAGSSGYCERDFRSISGPMPQTGDVMLSLGSSSVFPSFGLGNGSTCGIPPCFQSWHDSRGRPYDEASGNKFEKSLQTLEAAPRQGLFGSTVGWARGVGELLVANQCGDAGPVLFSGILRAASRHHRECRKTPSLEVEVDTGKGGNPMCSSHGEVVNGSKPACDMGGMRRLPCPLEGTSEDQCTKEEKPNKRSIQFQREVRGSERDSEVTARVDAARSGFEVDSRSSADADSGCELQGQGEGEASQDLEAHDVRICQHGSRTGVHGVQGLPRWGDGSVCGEKACTNGGDGAPGRPADEDQRRACSDAEVGAQFSIPKESFIKEGAEGFEGQSTWVRLKRPVPLEEKVQKMQLSGHFLVEEVFIEEQGNLCPVTVEDLKDAEECVLLVRQSRRNQMEEICEEVSESALPRKTKTRLRKAEKELEKVGVFPVAVSEVYSHPRVTDAARKKQLSTGGAYDLLTGFDLRLRKDLEKMWKELLADDPELVTCSPPCRPFSLLQCLNFPKMSMEAVIELVGEGLHHVRQSVRVCKWQHERGKLFFFEHPRTSKAWDEEEVQELMQLEGVFVCDFDMCQYGMKVDGVHPNQKPTRVVVNSEFLAKELQRRCLGDHQHDHLMGGKAVKAAHYPQQLCDAIVKGVKAHLRHQDRKKVMSAEFLQDEQVILVENEEEDPLVELDRERGYDEEEPEMGEEVEAVREDRVERAEDRLPTAVSHEDQMKLKKMHVNLGHPSKPSFLRFLRAGRVREEILRWVRQQFECETCESQKLPKAPRPAIVPRCYAPGLAVGLDIFYVPDVHNQRSVPVLNLVDLGTNFQMVEVVENKEPLHIWQTFWRVWARTFGLPQYITIDEGREFRGGFAKLCASAGTVVFRTAARSPWQNGRVERHGGILKDMVEKCREEMPPTSLMELKQLLYACENAKNRYSNRSGYSPTQRQIGQWPRMPCSLMSDEELDPALQAQNCTDDFMQLMEMRRVAQQAFVKVSSQDAAAKALKARPRVHRSFSPGDVVYVFRSLRKRKGVRGEAGAQRGGGLGRKASWIGPGHVLATEGSVVWINMFGELWRAAVEQVRGATSLEKMGVEILNEECTEMQERLKRSSHRAGYRDITGEEFPEMEEEAAGQDEDQEVMREAVDEVAQEGEERGLPRPRLDESDYEPSILEDIPSQRQAVNEHEPRQVSIDTVAEPEGEVPVTGDQSPIRGEPTEEQCAEMIKSFEESRRLDGLPPQGYEAARRNVRAAWRRKDDQPYFNEVEVFFEDEKEEVKQEEPLQTKDYWVFDLHRNVLQRHHVVWRKALFNPSK